MNSNRNNSRGLQTRLSLVVLGIALGFAARWISVLIFGNEPEPWFAPLPDEYSVDAEEVVKAPTSDSDSNRLNSETDPLNTAD